MTTSYADVLLQLFDDYGEILAGGKVETFEAGTSTPLATYQDLDGNVANTNPVILDSAGRAEIRLTDGVAYKFIVYDADDNELFSRDDIVVGAASSTSGQAYLVHMVYEGVPGAQAFMGGHIFDDDVDFPVDFEGALGSVETAPGTDFIISIRKNGVEVGTATVDSGGTYEFETVSHATVSFANGDKMTFVGPASAGTASDFIMTIPGELA